MHSSTLGADDPVLHGMFVYKNTHLRRRNCTGVDGFPHGSPEAPRPCPEVQSANTRYAAAVHPFVRVIDSNTLTHTRTHTLDAIVACCTHILRLRL